MTGPPVDGAAAVDGVLVSMAVGALGWLCVGAPADCRSAQVPSR